MTQKNEEKITVVEFQGEVLRTQEDFKLPDGIPVQRLRNVFGMTRDEAVQRMGPAIYKALNTGISFDHSWEQIKKEMAQAALDALLEYLLQAAAKNTVLDVFMGSGTTLVACEKLGLQGTGIEINEKYFDVACRRVEEAGRGS